MKNLIKVALVATGIFAAAQTQAQTRDTTLGQKIDKTATKVGKATAKTAKKVGNATATAAKATAKGVTKAGNKTAELAAKGAAAVDDRKYKGKAGPNNENIYIDGKTSRYYYVDKTGHRVYVTQAELKTKVE